MKKSVILMVGILAVALAGSAQAATMFAVQNAAAVDQMVVTDTGYVGIGTTTPLRTVHVQGVDTLSSQMLLNTVATGAALGGGMLYYHNNAGMTLPLNGDRLGYFLFGAFDSTTGGVGRNGAGLTAKAEGNWVGGTPGPAAVGSYFTFETTPSGASGRLERMRISGAGNVGIGTVAIGTPLSKLQVVGLPGPFADNTAARTALGGATPANAVGAFYLCPGTVAPASQQICVVY